MTTPNEICQENTPEVWRQLRDNSLRWTTLDLSRQNGLNQDGLEGLTQALVGNTVVAALYLEENHLTDVEPLCELLAAGSNRTALTVLDLGANRIDNQGAEQLARALQTNTTLSELYLNNNMIGEKGAQALLDTLMGPNKTLSVLDLGGNNISNELHAKLDSVSQLQQKQTGWVKHKYHVASTTHLIRGTA